MCSTSSTQPISHSTYTYSSEFDSELDDTRHDEPIALAGSVATANDMRILLDSGASCHCVPFGTHLTNVIPTGTLLRNASGVVMKSALEGTATLQTTLGGLVRLQRVFTHPNLHSHLLSIGRMCAAGCTVTFTNVGAKVIDAAGKLVLTATCVDNLYLVDAFISTTHAPSNVSEYINSVSSANSIPAAIWHYRMAHTARSSMQRLLDAKAVVDHEGIHSLPKDHVCDSCMQGKMTRSNIAHAIPSRYHADRILGRVHADLLGPLPKSLQGYEYMLLIVDEFTRMSFVFALKSKGAAAAVIMQWCLAIAVTKQTRIGEFHSDNGGEFTSIELTTFFAKQGITATTTYPYTPQQNGIAERMNRTILNAARSMLLHANGSLLLWSESVLAACHVRNRSTLRSGTKHTPEALWSNAPTSNVGHLRVWGCDAWVHIRSAPKLEAQSWRGMLVGYDQSNGELGYRVLRLETGVVETSRDVGFDESSFMSSITYSTNHDSDGSFEKAIAQRYDLQLAIALSQSHAQPSDAPPQPSISIEPQQHAAPASKSSASTVASSAHAHTPARSSNPLSLPPKPIMSPAAVDRLMSAERQRFNDSPQGAADNERYIAAIQVTAGVLPRRVLGRSSLAPANERRILRQSGVLWDNEESDNNDENNSEDEWAPPAPTAPRARRSISHASQPDMTEFAAARQASNESNMRRSSILSSSMPKSPMGPSSFLPLPTPAASPAAAASVPLPLASTHTLPTVATRSSSRTTAGVAAVRFDDEPRLALSVVDINADTTRPTLMSDYAHFNAATVQVADPLHYKDSLTHPNREGWKKAYAVELGAMVKMGVWEYCLLPRGCFAIGCRWVSRTKYDEKGNISRLKARIVVKGYNQREGIDFDQTFAPVLKYTTLRVLLSIIATLDYEFLQFDVPTAFLNADLQEEVYMDVPEGVEGRDQLPPGTVCRLKKALYGLKQSPREWNKDLDRTILSLGWTRCITDSCLYVKVSATKKSMFLPVFVDDGFPACHATDMDEMMIDIKSIMTKYHIENIGKASLVLGMRVTRNRANRTLTLDHQLSIVRLGETHQMSAGAKALLTPMIGTAIGDLIGVTTPSSAPVDETESDAEASSASSDFPHYRSLVGALNYIAASVRPDISFCVSTLSSSLINPQASHWRAARRCLQYLLGTAEIGLSYGRNCTVDMTNDVTLGPSYCDASWAGDARHRRSQLAYVMQVNGGTVSWASQKQATVARSSCESEYVAMSNATCEILWLRSLLKEMGYEQLDATTLYCDNQPAIDLANDTGINNRTKHIDIAHHFMRQHIEERRLFVAHMPTDRQLADMLTKSLGAHKHVYNRDLIMHT